MLKFLVHRVLAIPVTLLIVTAVLYGIIVLAPADARVEMYMPRGGSNNPNLHPEVLRQPIIEQHGLNDPYPVQYSRWVSRLAQGTGGGARDSVLTFRPRCKNAPRQP